MRMVPRYYPTRQEAAAIAAQPKAVTFMFTNRAAVMLPPPDLSEVEEAALHAAVARTNHLKTNGGRGMRS